MNNSWRNNSTRAIFSDILFASGTFKNVYAGCYIEGTRAGQRCVSKEFKTPSDYEVYYFEEEMNIIRCTQKIIDDWHNANLTNKRVVLNTPEIWEQFYTGRHRLVEPMVENFVKWNSNTGWVNTAWGGWSQSMQALSHFSYHSSGGQFLLCDLQGGSYQTGYILTDPVILSQSQTYGPTDLGPDGIFSFFQRHQCGQFCGRSWLWPPGLGTTTIPLRPGTTLVARLPTRASRNPPSRVQSGFHQYGF